MPIVTLDAPLPRTLPTGLTTLVEATHTHTYTQGALFLLRLHQMGTGESLLAGENFQAPGDTEWPFDLNTYAWSVRHGWVCLAWPDGTFVVGQPHPTGGWSFFPTPFQLHPWFLTAGSPLEIFERNSGTPHDLQKLAAFVPPPLDANRWGTPWLSGTPSPIAECAFLAFLHNAVDAAGLAIHTTQGVHVTGAIGLGQGRWMAPDLVVDFRTPPQGQAWDDVRCVLAHRPPFAPGALLHHAPHWTGRVPHVFEPESIAMLVGTHGRSAHQQMAFQHGWAQRLAEARSLQERGLCRPDTLLHPDEVL
jgi:hypothetical protein